MRAPATAVLLTAGLLVFALSVRAQTVTVTNAWVRGTVPAQTTTGAYMDITSRDGGKLVGVASPLAGSVEMHEMRMQGNVMGMREMDKVELPAGKTVKFDPSGYHLMLLNLKHPLQPGAVAPLTLTIEGRDGKRGKIEVQAEIRALGAH
jgi:periplasmic copper chaperone A